MDEIKRNGEGYYDPTAYEAIKRMEDMDMEEVKAGEVWEAVTGTETGLFIIIDLEIEKTEKRVYKSLYENLLREVIGQ